MKKLVIALIAAMLFVTAAAAETAYVSITTGDGSIPLARQAVELTDADGDQTISINDALVIAHDLYFEGGAAEGFISEDQGYGLSMYMLWGEDNGGSYGYYVNNASSFSLLDPINEGDHVKAYSYMDLSAWSDTYCYFDREETAAGEIELTLTALVLDANWMPVPTPVEGAVITVDGADTGFVTDADGRAIVTVESGAKLISARSDAMVLVPPVCIVNEG